MARDSLKSESIIKQMSFFSFFTPSHLKNQIFRIVEVFKGGAWGKLLMFGLALAFFIRWVGSLVMGSFGPEMIEIWVLTGLGLFSLMGLYSLSRTNF